MSTLMALYRSEPPRLKPTYFNGSVFFSDKRLAAFLAELADA